MLVDFSQVTDQKKSNNVSVLFSMLFLIGATSKC